MKDLYKRIAWDLYRILCITIMVYCFVRALNE